MIFPLILFLIGQLTLTAVIKRFDPTASESSLYLAINPKPSWGNQMRQQKSIRILLLGGSNSIGCCCSSTPFSKVVDSNISHEYSNSYLLNGAISGSRPYMFIGQTYEFETWPIARWPNILLLEISLNSDIGWSSALEIDNLIFQLLEKWELVGLPPPDIVFLELFGTHLYDKLSGMTDNKENRTNLLNSYESSPSSGAIDKLSVNMNPRQVYIDAVARYYSYPVLSVRNSWWPAFTRFFIKNSYSKRWPYLYDNAHATCIGHEYIGNKVILHFLREQMRKKEKSEEEDDPETLNSYSKSNNTEVRMFPKSLYSKVLKIWPVWGVRSNNNSHISQFRKIVEPTKGWDFTYLDNGHHKVHSGHDCYGSRGDNKLAAAAFFVIDVPATCERCKIQISYLRSWNESYIGDVLCNLYSAEQNSHPISNLTILGNTYRGVAMKATLPGETAFPSPVSGGSYKVKCSKLDKKFACICRFAIYSN